MAKRKLKDRGSPVAGRKQNNRALRQNFLIVCEGEQTEPNYFKKFRVPSTIVIGAGRGGLRLVEDTIRIRRYEAQKKGSFAQTWCVFDKDETPDEAFRQALRTAENHDIQVAYSNAAFELWFYLHFVYHNRDTHRADYIKLLTECLGSAYQKNQADMYDILFDRQPEALRNAARLLACYQPHDPARDNPCTTVHKLVEALNSQAV